MCACLLVCLFVCLFVGVFVCVVCFIVCLCTCLCVLRLLFVLLFLCVCMLVFRLFGLIDCCSFVDFVCLLVLSGACVFCVKTFPVFSPAVVKASRYARQAATYKVQADIPVT